MRNFLFVPLFVILLFPGKLYADFSASGGQNAVPYDYTPAASTGLEHVYVFYGMANALISYTCSSPSEAMWYQYTDPDQPQPVSAADITVGMGVTTLNRPQHGYGYYVQLGESKYAVFVVDYTALDFAYTDLRAVTDADDICSSLQLVVEGSLDDIEYIPMLGSKKKIEREHTLSYTDAQWSAEDKKYIDVEKKITREGYLSNIVIDAPLQNVQFLLEGDQLAAYFGANTTKITLDYEAVRVCTNALAEAEVKTVAENEIATSGDGLIGSAPYTVNFYSYANAPTTYCRWYIYTTPQSTEDYLYRNETDIYYTFYQAGTYQVKLLINNSVCSDSTTFSITVTESSLDCPNFFSPRSTPGDNDEFRVAYKSLVKFHGRIVNRWGNLMFEWSDPSQGWDGTYRGKPVSPGVYFYIISATGSDGIEYMKKGDINLLE